VVYYITKRRKFKSDFFLPPPAGAIVWGFYVSRLTLVFWILSFDVGIVFCSALCSSGTGERSTVVRG